jgi:outer membrane protein assembly factor BamB
MMMLRLNDDGAAKELWRKPGVMPSFPHAVIVAGNLYCFHGNNLTCVDAATGNVLQQTPAEGRPGAVIAADGLVIWQTGVPVPGSKGSKIRITLTEATPKGFNVLGAFDTPVRCDADPPWIHPAVAGGRLYVRFHSQLAVYDLKAP